MPPKTATPDVPSTGITLGTLRVFQLTLALLLLSSVGYIAKFTTFWASPNFKPTNEDVMYERLTHLEDVLVNRGPNRYFVPDFDAAETFLINSNLIDGPVYVLLSSGEENGTYWNDECKRAIQPIQEALERAPANIRLLEVSVGDSRNWHDDFNSFRSKSLFHIRKIPALLQYTGNLKTSNLLSERFNTEPELLDFVFGTKKPNPRGAKVIREVDEMITLLNEYKGDYPLFLSFTSGLNDQTGRLWCPFCDMAEIPIQYYFEQYAPTNAVLVKLVVADSYAAWKSKENPFRKQTVARVSGLPTLSRATKANPTDEVFVREYLPNFEDTASLRAFFEASD